VKRAVGGVRIGVAHLGGPGQSRALVPVLRPARWPVVGGFPIWSQFGNFRQRSLATSFWPILDIHSCHD
jgi:hypothetical protein